MIALEHIYSEHWKTVLRGGLMGKTSVYWCDARAPPSYVEKGQKLFEDAGLMDCFRNGDSVAIKAHCGDWNNTGYLRPNIVAGIVESVREYGGDPFVCDTTTLIGGHE
jgi:uncharacterized Fe-S center protein